MRARARRAVMHARRAVMHARRVRSSLGRVWRVLRARETSRDRERVIRSGPGAQAGRHAVMTHDCHCAMHCVACRTATARQRVFNHKVRNRAAGPTSRAASRPLALPRARGATSRSIIPASPFTNEIIRRASTPTAPTGTGHATGHVDDRAGAAPARASDRFRPASNLPRLLDIYGCSKTYYVK
jgi:hypothetical protein